jgi:mannose-6-phosphate isomerase-like protein (cupin superfamily)
MHHEELDFVEGWRQVARSENAAAATMVLAPDTAEGGPDNLHPASDQWIYVVAGEGAALVQDELHVLRPGVLLLVERGETHEIRNTGSVPLRTLSVYVPPLTGE